MLGSYTFGQLLFGLLHYRQHHLLAQISAHYGRPNEARKNVQQTFHRSVERIIFGRTIERLKNVLLKDGHHKADHLPIRQMMMTSLIRRHIQQHADYLFLQEE